MGFKTFVTFLLFSTVSCETKEAHLNKAQEEQQTTL
jgi:hypothetical protein